MNKPLHQRVIIGFAWVLGGLLAVGNVLSAISSAVSLIIPTVTYFGTILGLVLWLIIELLIKLRGIEWAAKDGQRARLHSLGAKPRLAIIGAILLLWLPRLVDRFVAPNIEVSFFPNSSLFGHVVPTIHDDGSSEPVSFQVELTNTGRSRVMGVVMISTFRPGIEPQLIQGAWQKKDIGNGFVTFSYEDPTVALYAGPSRALGKFQIRIPPRSSSDELLALFEVHGDFQQKWGLLYYDRIGDTYRTSLSKTPDEAVRIWNEHVAKWNSILGKQGSPSSKQSK